MTAPRRSPGAPARASAATSIADQQPTSGARDFVDGLHRRRAASLRLEPLACGCRDPWCAQRPRGTGGYADAAAHLLSHGLMPAADVVALRELWRIGGEYRELAEQIAEAGGVVA